MSVRDFIKGVWQFCSYLFVPQWEEIDVRSQRDEVRFNGVRTIKK